MTLICGVSTRMFPLPERHMRDADSVGWPPLAGWVLLAQSEQEGGVGGGENDCTARKCITLGSGFGDLFREEVIHGIALVLPRLEAPQQRPNLQDPDLLQVHRHLCAGRLARAGAIENDVPVSRDLRIPHGEFIG